MEALVFALKTWRREEVCASMGVCSCWLYPCYLGLLKKAVAGKNEVLVLVLILEQQVDLNPPKVLFSLMLNE